MKEQESVRSKIMQSGKPGLLFRMPETYFRIKLAKRDQRFNAFLLGVAGMVMSLSFAQLMGLGARYQTGQIMSGILILGPLVGLLHFGTSGIIAKWLGKWLGEGKPSYKTLSSFSVDAARPLAYVSPLAWIGVFWLGNDGFGAEGAANGIGYVLLGLQFAALLLGGYYWLVGLKTACQFSWAKAAMAGILSWMLSLGLAFWAMSNLFGIQLV
jgi:hypothetical protein